MAVALGMLTGFFLLTIGVVVGYNYGKGGNPPPLCVRKIPDPVLPGKEEDDEQAHKYR